MEFIRVKNKESDFFFSQPLVCTYRDSGILSIFILRFDKRTFKGQINIEIRDEHKRVQYDLVTHGYKLFSVQRTGPLKGTTTVLLSTAQYWKGESKPCTTDSKLFLHLYLWYTAEDQRFCWWIPSEEFSLVPDSNSISTVAIPYLGIGPASPKITLTSSRQKKRKPKIFWLISFVIQNWCHSFRPADLSCGST